MGYRIRYDRSSKLESQALRNQKHEIASKVGSLIGGWCVTSLNVKRGRKRCP
jgi:hypothetical protein